MYFLADLPTVDFDFLVPEDLATFFGKFMPYSTIVGCAIGVITVCVILKIVK